MHSEVCIQPYHNTAVELQGCCSMHAVKCGIFMRKVLQKAAQVRLAMLVTTFLKLSSPLFAEQAQHTAALEQLSHAVDLAPNEPLPCLLLGIAHLAAAMSRKTPDRDRAVLLAFTSLQVRQLCCPARQHLLVGL